MYIYTYSSSLKLLPKTDLSIPSFDHSSFVCVCFGGGGTTHTQPPSRQQGGSSSTVKKKKDSPKSYPGTVSACAYMCLWRRRCVWMCVYCFNYYYTLGKRRELREEKEKKKKKRFVSVCVCVCVFFPSVFWSTILLLSPWYDIFSEELEFMDWINASSRGWSKVGGVRRVSNQPQPGCLLQTDDRAQVDFYLPSPIEIQEDIQVSWSVFVQREKKIYDIFWISGDYIVAFRRKIGLVDRDIFLPIGGSNSKREPDCRFLVVKQIQESKLMAENAKGREKV